MEGLVLFNKPKNYTCTQITNFFKKLTNKKVGHSGALDPLASGLLIIGIGKATRELTKFLKKSRKIYLGEMFLGAISDTYDSQGKIQKTNGPLPEISQIESVLKNFIGEIKQIPPLYSSIKIKGERAYNLARKGEKIDLKARKVKIYSLKILDYQKPILKFEAEVSSGTYIRSLVNDLGKELGCGGYLNNLIRTKINSFELENALTFKDFKIDYLEFVAKIFGKVQGVGFRFFVNCLAKKLEISGYVKNLSSGQLEVVAQGKEKNLQSLIENLKIGPRLAKVEKIEIIFRKPKKIFSDFKIF